MCGGPGGITYVYTHAYIHLDLFVWRGEFMPATVIFNATIPVTQPMLVVSRANSDLMLQSHICHGKVVAPNIPKVLNLFVERIHLHENLPSHKPLQHDEHHYHHHYAQPLCGWNLIQGLVQRSFCVCACNVRELGCSYLPYRGP